MVEAVQIDTTSKHTSMVFDCTDDVSEERFETQVTVEAVQFQPRPRRQRKPMTDSEAVVTSVS